jgi:regulator of replication initiation timing
MIGAADDSIVDILRLRIRELQDDIRFRFQEIHLLQEDIRRWKQVHTEAIEVNNRYLEENRRLKARIVELEAATQADAAADSTNP